MALTLYLNHDGEPCAKEAMIHGVRRGVSADAKKGLHVPFGGQRMDSVNQARSQAWSLLDQIGRSGFTAEPCPRYQRCTGHLDADRRGGTDASARTGNGLGRADASADARTAFLRAVSGPDEDPEPKSDPGRPVRLRPARQAYQYGAEGPNAYDCSGLTMKAGRRRASTSPARPTPVRRHQAGGRGQLQPGDLVFFNNLGHVGLYVGNGR